MRSHGTYKIAQRYGRHMNPH